MGILHPPIALLLGIPGDPAVKRLPANAGDTGNVGSIPGSGRFPWMRAWQPTPVFLPGESPWTEEPCGLQSTGSHRAKHDCDDLHKRTVSIKGQTSLGGPGLIGWVNQKAGYHRWAWSNPWSPSNGRLSWVGVD